MGKKVKAQNYQGNERIIPVAVDEQYKLDYGKYTYFVSLERICPDYRDGLLNAHRAVITAAKLFAGAENHLVKCGTIVGDAMKIHPHGDQSIYGTIVSLGTHYNQRYPLFTPKGTFGTIDGDEAAASRYTEAKLSQFTRDCITKDLKSYGADISTDWKENYSRTLMVPEYLPAVIPVLLTKGSFAIGVGDSITCPSHNVCDVIDAMLTLMRNPNAPIVLIPDFPLPAEIVDNDWKKISKHGVGKYTVRGIVKIEQYGGKHSKYKGRQILRILSLPPQVRTQNVIDKIGELMNDKKITQIEDYESNAVMDEHTKELNVDLSLILKEGADPNYVRGLLFKHTELQKSFAINLQVKKDGRRVRVGYAEYLNMFLNYRRENHIRQVYNKISDLRTRNAQLESFIYLIDSGKYDQIQDFVRKQKKAMTEAELKQLVIDKFNIDPIQATYALKADLTKQAGFARNSMSSEVKGNAAKIEELLTFVRNPALVDNTIAEELLEIKGKHGDPRRCVLVKKDSGGIQGRFLCCLSETNRIKLQSVNEPLTCSKGDSIRTVIEVDAAKGILVFTDNGRCFRIPAEKIPFSPAGTSGEDIRIVNKNVGGNITFIVPEDFMEGAIKRKDFLISLTKEGYIKRVALDDFSNVPFSGTTYAKLDEGDRVVNVCISRPDLRVIVFNKEKALDMGMQEIAFVKRNARGVIAMKSKTGVEGMTAVLPDMTDLLVITEKGYINRISPISIKSGRAKAPSGVIKLKEGDAIKTVLAVTPGHVLRFSCQNEIVDIPVESIKVGSSVSTGTKCIKQNSGTIIRVDVI